MELMSATYTDYTFEILSDGSMLMDRDITSKDFPVCKSGDQYTFIINDNGRVVFRRNVVQNEP